MTEYLDLEDLLVAADAAVGGSAELRDIGLLEAAAGRPHATAFGEEAYPDLDRKAAALLHSIVTSHPLVDGNKRLGWVALRLFYLMNDAEIAVDVDEAYDLIVGVAEGRVRDIPAIAKRLAAWRSRP